MTETQITAREAIEHVQRELETGVESGYLSKGEVTKAYQQGDDLVMECEITFAPKLTDVNINLYLEDLNG